MLPNKYTYYKELPESYLNQVLRWEGGYVNDIDDLGKETCRGVTIGALNAAKKQGLVAQSVTIKSLLNDIESVRKIYNVNYYLKGHCDQLPHPLAFAHVDCCINSGIGGKNKSGKAIGAGAILQKALVSMGANVVVDGSVGPKTLAALDDILTKKSAAEVAKVYNDIRQQYYHEIVAARPANQKFLKGWLNRLNDVRKFCGN